MPVSLIIQSKLEFSRLEGLAVGAIHGETRPCVLCRRYQTEFQGSAGVKDWRSPSRGAEDQLRTDAVLVA